MKVTDRCVTSRCLFRYFFKSLFSLPRQIYKLYKYAYSPFSFFKELLMYTTIFSLHFIFSYYLPFNKLQCDTANTKQLQSEDFPDILGMESGPISHTDLILMSPSIIHRDTDITFLLKLVGKDRI